DPDQKITGRVTATALRDKASVIAQVDGQIARSLATWTGGPEAKFRELMNDDAEIGARAAVEIGLLTSCPSHPEWKRRSAPPAPAAADNIDLAVAAIRRGRAAIAPRRPQQRAVLASAEMEMQRVARGWAERMRGHLLGMARPR